MGQTHTAAKINTYFSRAFYGSSSKFFIWIDPCQTKTQLWMNEIWRKLPEQSHAAFSLLVAHLFGHKASKEDVQSMQPSWTLVLRGY